MSKCSARLMYQGYHWLCDFGEGHEMPHRASGTGYDSDKNDLLGDPIYELRWYEPRRRVEA